MNTTIGVILALTCSLAWALGALSMAKARVHGGKTLSGYVVDRFSSIFFTVLYFLATQRVLTLKPIVLLSFFAASIFGGVVGYLSYYAAINTIGAGRTTMVNVLRPFLAAAISVPLFQEEISLGILSGMVLVTLGILTVIKGEATTSSSSRGFLYALLAMFGFTLFPVLMRVGLDAGGHAAEGAMLSFIFSLALYLLLMTAFKKPPDVRSVPKRAAFFYALSGFFNAVGSIALIHALENAPIVIVLPVSNSYPFMTVFLATLLLKERLTPALILGCMAIALGIALVSI
ncbi:MAG: DMT family transporter [Nitrososphaerales archaeon]